MNIIKHLVETVWLKLLILISITLFVFYNTNVDAKEIDVFDCLGREIHISLPIKRIVVLNSDALEVIRILNAENLVVGVYCEINKEPFFWGNLVKLPKVGSWNNANAEKIALLEPNLVIAYGRSPGPELDTQLKALGIKLLRLDFYKINNFEKELNTLATVLNKAKEAQKFLSWYRKKLNFIAQKLHYIDKKPTVYVESYNNYVASGPGSGADEMCNFAGGKNIGRQFNIPYPHVTPEWIVSQDPEIIIKPASWERGYSQKDKTFFNKIKEKILKRPGVNLIRAIKHNKAYVIDSSIWCGPQAIIGIAYLAKWFHPNIFKDLNPKIWHQEYLSKFQKIPYKGYYVSD